MFVWPCFSNTGV